MPDAWDLLTKDEEMIHLANGKGFEFCRTFPFKGAKHLMITHDLKKVECPVCERLLGKAIRGFADKNFPSPVCLFCDGRLDESNITYATVGGETRMMCASCGKKNGLTEKKKPSDIEPPMAVKAYAPVKEVF